MLTLELASHPIVYFRVASVARSRREERGPNKHMCFLSSICLFVFNKFSYFAIYIRKQVGGLEEALEQLAMLAGAEEVEDIPERFQVTRSRVYTFWFFGGGGPLRT